MRTGSRIKFSIIAALWLCGFITAMSIAFTPHVLIMAPGIDKLGHLAAFGFLTLWPAMLLTCGKKQAFAAMALFALGIGIEIAQNYIPARSPEVMDALFNTFGIALGMILGMTLGKALNNPKPILQIAR